MDKQTIYKALESVVSVDRVKGLQVDDCGNVLFSIVVDPAQGTQMEDIRLNAEKAVMAVQGIESVTAVLNS